jgi:hypothetical protein
MRLFRCFFPNLRNFGTITTNRVEGEHNAQKLPGNLNRNTKLFKVVRGEFNRLEQRNRERIEVMKHHQFKPKLHENENEWIRQLLTSYGAQKLQEQIELSSFCQVIQKEYSFEVKYERGKYLFKFKFIFCLFID